ncbi:MAG: hypothetical protein QOF56_2978 [Acidobacteriaceae bacterium]|nr:hypothetical protein [Acidobacteriaceae bacterium]
MWPGPNRAKDFVLVRHVRIYRHSGNRHVGRNDVNDLKATFGVSFHLYPSFETRAGRIFWHLINARSRTP